MASKYYSSLLRLYYLQSLEKMVSKYYSVTLIKRKKIQASWMEEIKFFLVGKEGNNRAPPTLKKSKEGQGDRLQCFSLLAL